jgi:hypothetical protein
MMSYHNKARKEMNEWLIKLLMCVWNDGRLKKIETSKGCAYTMVQRIIIIIITELKKWK